MPTGVNCRVGKNKFLAFSREIRCEKLREIHCIVFIAFVLSFYPFFVQKTALFILGFSCFYYIYLFLLCLWRITVINRHSYLRKIHLKSAYVMKWAHLVVIWPVFYTNDWIFCCLQVGIITLIDWATRICSWHDVMCFQTL